MSPPDLTRNAPVADIFHPVKIGLFPALRGKGNAARAHSFDSRRREWFHLDEPLLGEARFNNRIAPIAVSDRMRMRINLHEQPERFQIGNDLLTTGETIHARILASLDIHVSFARHHIQHGQVVALRHLEVIGVMRRRDLHNTGTERAVHIIIRNHRDLAVHQGEHHGLADQGLIAFVSRIDRDCGIAQHGLGTCRRNNHFASTGYRVTDMPQVADRIHVFALFIRERGMAARTPVHNIVSAINQPFFVKTAEDFGDGLAQPLIHGEALA